jgi:protein-tyrosine phosphatase
VAAALFQRHLAQQAMLEGWRIASAGTWARNGRPADRQMRALAQAAGLDLSHHRAQDISEVPGLDSYALILTMERHQCEALQAEFPYLRDRIYLLSQFAGPPFDIADPVGGPAGQYQQCFDQLALVVRTAFPKIVAFVEQQSTA